MSCLEAASIAVAQKKGSSNSCAAEAFAGQKVGVKQVEERIWLMSFMRYDPGFVDHETCRIATAENPFAAKVLPMSPVSPE